MQNQLPTAFARKRILITGASSGIGRAVAFKFLNSGAKVALIGRDIQALTQIGQQFPHQAIAIQCDLSVDIQQYDMSKAIIQHLGGLDMLINAAGVIFDGDVQKTYPQDFDYVVDINVRCPFHLINLFLPFLKRSKGCVVNVSASSGHVPQQGAVSYSVSKAGLEMLTKVVALQLAPQGVRVNAVAPTGVDTNFLRYQGLKQDEYNMYKKRKANTIPLKRLCLPEEVAKCIVFLASQKAVSITGHIMNVDGGFSLTSSSFAHWFGAQMMNRRFDPTSKNFVSYYYDKLQKKFTTGVKQPQPGTLEWMKAKHKSTWGTNLEQAHDKITDQYQKIEGEQDELNQYVEMHMQGGAVNPRMAKKNSLKQNPGFLGF